MTPRPERLTPEKASALARSDGRRIVVMVIGVLVLAGGYFWAQTQKVAYEDSELAAVPAWNELPTERIIIPEFDMPEVLTGIRDDTQKSRLVVEPEPLNAVLDYGRLFTPRHYQAMDLTLLDAGSLATLEADPGAHRVQAYRARGELLALRKRQRSEARPEELTGTIRLEADAGVAHFVVLSKLSDPPALAVGDWVRVDGVFLKLFRSEGPAGWWEGPLLCGARVERSVAPIALDEPIPTDALAAVEDDSLEQATGLSEAAKWELMARALAAAKGLSVDPIDWSSVPLLDDQTVGEVFLDGEKHRGKPFRFEVLRNLDGRTLAVEENPLRIEKMTTGWIASQTWKGPAHAVHYLAPFDKPVLSTRYGDAKFVTGHGFFFKNMSYETATGNLGRVPVFVLAAIEPFRPPEDRHTAMLMTGVFVATVLLLLLLVFLVMRDKRRSQALQDELVRRRRARRERRAVAEGGT